MRLKQPNLWPLLPFAIIALALGVAQFVPEANSEQVRLTSTEGKEKNP